MKQLRCATCLAIAWLMCCMAFGETITSSVIGSGGASSTGSTYKLSGTIGQSVTKSSDGGTYVVESGFWNAVLYVVFPGALESFANWMNQLDPADLPPEGQRGSLDEPAGDGVANIFKYAFGLQPLDPSRDGYPHYVHVLDPGNPDQVLLAIEFIRSTTANVNLLLEGSDNLSVWGDISFTEEVVESLPNDRERIRLTSDVSLAPGDKYFLRLEVNSP